MDSSWYTAFFTEDYWQVAEPQCSAAQTAMEIAYLQKVLEATAPGRRVVDLGCGIGRHAMALARAGFGVTGMDVSPWAIGEARRRSTAAGVGVRWEVVDLLRDDAWPLTEVDAAICMDAFGFGSDAEQRRFLRRVRRYLAPDGLLILSCPNLFWVIRHPMDPVRKAVGSMTYTFHQHYDPVQGRSQGSLTVANGDDTARVYPYDLRRYTPAELVAVLREAGFSIVQLGADFVPHRPVSVEARFTQACARPVPVPPASLAVTSWRTPPEQRLDLRYAPDEAAWLARPPHTIWAALLDGEPHQGAAAVSCYPVDDPYGSERAAPVASTYFGCDLPPDHLLLGPGVTSLLHDLCGLADGGLILAPQLVHPDLTAWAVARGGAVHFVEEPASLDRLLDEIRARGPALVQLDRPRLFDSLIALDDLHRLGVAAAEVGAVVLVDESPATYLGPSGSAVPLIHHLDNLVVLRGLTKAYSWGGLRVGFAVASKGVSARVRELVCPLQVGELALRAALRLLEAGDLFGPLRARIRTVKPITMDLFKRLGLAVQEVHPDVPWLVVPDDGEATSRLLDRFGIRGLRFVPSPALRGPFPERLLLFCPLSDERLAQLHEHLTGAFEAASLSITQEPDNDVFYRQTQSDRP